LSCKSDSLLKDGYSNGREIYATTTTEHLWNREILEDNRISVSGKWTDIIVSSLSFTLTNPTKLRFTYLMTVRLDIIKLNNYFSRHDLSARLIIDDNSFSDSLLSVSTNTISFGFF